MPMRRGCRTEHLLKVCLTGILLISAGCRRAPVRTISTGEWLYEIGTRAGIPQNDAPPYFIDINESSLYYHAVQDAAGWGIIDTRHPMDPEQPLTKEFAAYSLVNLAGLQQTSSDLQIRDISDSPFREQIEQSVGFAEAGGLFA